MRDPRTPTRRLVLRLLAGIAAVPSLACAAPDAPQDRGIGGTGARPPEDETPGGDRGIGGTGVIGTIRRFGSIVVNDLRIAYPKDVTVRIDGAPAAVSDLKIGHVVRVVAEPGKAGLSTKAIDVTSEVVGPVEVAAKGRLTVLGQIVTTAGVKGSWKTGERVAVSGLRQPDGTIVASLIEARPDGAARVAGPVRKGPDGTATIGGLKLSGLESNLVGRRVVAEGTAEAGTLAVASARDASRPFAIGLRRVSIEAYVGRSGESLRLGSGVSVTGTPGADIPRSGSVRAVLTTGVARDGRLTLDAVRIEGRDGRGPSPGERGFGGQGPGGTGPGGPGPGGPRGGPDMGPGRGGQSPSGPPSRGPGPGFDRGGGFERPGGRYGIDPRMPGGGPDGGGPGGGFGGGPGGGPGGGAPGGYGGGGPGGGPGGFGGGGPGGPGGGGPGGPGGGGPGGGRGR